jgi:glycosyltransferase involved in cell wall biosynthesis
MKILVFIHSNKRTIPIDVPLIELAKKGHSVQLLTIYERDDLHTYYEALGFKADAMPQFKAPAGLYHFYMVRYLIKYCKTNKIDAVFSHLQQANLIAVLASKFMRAKVYPFRHHFKSHHLVPAANLAPNKNEVMADKIINKLASRIFVPGRGVKEGMVRTENIAPDKIEIVPYAYKFGEMLQQNRENVQAIRKQYPAKLLLIIVSRLIAYKRPFTALEVVEKLRKKGLDVKLLIMDEGPEKPALQKYVQENNLTEAVFFGGFVPNILEYISAADIMLNPSLTDASNSAIKEAGLLEKIVITGKHVGDVDDYFNDRENGFLVDADKFTEQAVELVTEIYNQPEKFKAIGPNLKQTVLQHFSLSDKLVNQYQHILNRKN